MSNTPANDANPGAGPEGIQMQYGATQIRLDLDLSVFAGQVRLFGSAAEGLVLTRDGHNLKLWKDEAHKQFHEFENRWSNASDSVLFSNGATLRFRLARPDDHEFLAVRGCAFSFIGVEDPTGETPIVDLALLASLLRSQTMPSWALYLGLIHRKVPTMFTRPVLGLQR